MGQTDTTTNAERELPGMSHSKRSTDIRVITTCFTTPRTMVQQVHRRGPPVRAVNHLRLQVYRHVSGIHCTCCHRRDYRATNGDCGKPTDTSLQRTALHDRGVSRTSLAHPTVLESVLTFTATATQAVAKSCQSTSLPRQRSQRPASHATSPRSRCKISTRYR